MEDRQTGVAALGWVWLPRLGVAVGMTTASAHSHTHSHMLLKLPPAHPPGPGGGSLLHLLYPGALGAATAALAGAGPLLGDFCLLVLSPIRLRKTLKLGFMSSVIKTKQAFEFQEEGEEVYLQEEYAEKHAGCRLTCDAQHLQADQWLQRGWTQRVQVVLTQVEKSQRGQAHQSLL